MARALTARTLALTKALALAPVLAPVLALVLALILVLVPVLAPLPAHASDHWDGPAVSKEAAADIADFYAVALADGRLALVLNVYPGASAASRFSDAVEYRMRLRPISGFSQAPLRAIVGDDEVRIACRADQQPRQAMRCTASRRGVPFASASATLGVLTATAAGADDNGRSGGSGGALRLFAGARADQSFTDLARVRLPVWRDESMDARPGLNALAGKNVLSIVLTLDTAPFERRSSARLWAAVAETHLTGLSPGRPSQIDRLGRIEMTVFLVRDDALKDLWNRSDSFAADGQALAALRPALQDGLQRMDAFEKSLDGAEVVDWPAPHPMLDLLLDDFLILNLDAPASMDSNAAGYLGIEKALVLGRPAGQGGMGGRLPNEDAIAGMLTLLINGPRRDTPGRGVGVHAPDKPAVAAFPYVQPPTP